MSRRRQRFFNTSDDSSTCDFTTDASFSDSSICAEPSIIPKAQFDCDPAQRCQVIKGDKGLTGPTGPTGPCGMQGPPGFQGPPGIQGKRGPTGSIGNSGPTGPKGDIGLRGCIGAQGPTGMTGPTGPTGPSGNYGPTGSEGRPGNQGIRGEKGERGYMGTPGTAGPGGDHGPAGRDGPTADEIISNLPPSFRGPAGKDGPTLCDVVTEMRRHTIDFKGPTGPEGPPGPSTSVSEVANYLAKNYEHRLKGPTGPTGPSHSCSSTVCHEHSGLSEHCHTSTATASYPPLYQAIPGTGGLSVHYNEKHKISSWVMKNALPGDQITSIQSHYVSYEHFGTPLITVMEKMDDSYRACQSGCSSSCSDDDANLKVRLFFDLDNKQPPAKTIREINVIYSYMDGSDEKQIVTRRSITPQDIENGYCILFFRKTVTGIISMTVVIPLGEMVQGHATAKISNPIVRIT